MSANGTANGPQPGPSSQPGGPQNNEQTVHQLFSSLPHLMNLARENKMGDSHRRQLLSLLAVVTQQPQRFPQYAHLMGSIPALQAQLAQQTGAPVAQPAPPPPPPMNPQNALKRKSPGADPALTSQEQPAQPALTFTPATQPNPQPWPNAQGSRSTLSGGLAAGRVSGTPVLVSRGTEDLSMFTSPDWLNLARQTRKTSTSDSSMRRTIQDLVSSIDPNVKIDPEVEDLLLDVADEFIDSVANFSCKLAKHRGGDSLEVRDLQLHLERNHNIRIPGFASDETRMSVSQTSVPTASSTAATAAGRRAGMTMTLRSARLSAVQAAKRDAKLL